MDDRASSPREPDGSDRAGGTTLPQRCRFAAGPKGAAAARGVQAVGADESAPRVGQVLEELDEKLDGGEGLRVGKETVGLGCATDHGVRASLVDEQILQRHRGAHNVLGERFACFRGAGGNEDRCVHREAAVCPVKHVPGQPLAQELALQEKRDDPLAEAAAHLLQIYRWDVEESAFAVKASLQEQAVPMGIPSRNNSCGLQYHDCGGADGLAGGRRCEVVYQAVDEAADLAVRLLSSRKKTRRTLAG